MADNVYTLHYFDGYARGEHIRLLLAHANIKFEDHRISFSEWPGTLKATMPGGSMPCLETKDGNKMGESIAILRFLGLTHGYYPTDFNEAWACDSLIDGYSDIFNKISGTAFMPSGQAKEDAED